MPTLEERVAQLEADLPTRRGYVVELQSLRQGQQLLLQRMDGVELRMGAIEQRMGAVERRLDRLESDMAEVKPDLAEVKSDLKLILRHFKIET